MTAPRDLAHVSTAEEAADAAANLTPVRVAALAKHGLAAALVMFDMSTNDLLRVLARELARRAEAGGRAVADRVLAECVLRGALHEWAELRGPRNAASEKCWVEVVQPLLDAYPSQPQTAAPPVEPEALDAMTKERDALAKALQLMEHKVITCGVAAERGDLDGKKCYAETWNSPQAEKVRALRRERDELRAEIERAGATVDQLRPMLESALNDFRKMVSNWSGARKEGARWVEAWLVSRIDSLTKGGNRG
jgi:hypothetical protein